MTDRIKSLKEVSEEIGEEIGKPKSINTKDGYYVHGTRKHREFELIDSKIVTELSFEGKKQPISYGYFKSKKGYNSKFKNNKEYANHYGEYIAYIILKQLEKKACKVDIGSRDICHPFSNKIIEVDGILSHHQLSRTEIFRPFNVSMAKYKGAHPQKYEESMESIKDIARYKLSDLEEVLDIFPNLSEEHKNLAKKIFIEREIEFNDTLKVFKEKRTIKGDNVR